MENENLIRASTFRAHAAYLEGHLDFRTIRGTRLAKSPILMALNSGRIVALFRTGVLVEFDTSDSDLQLLSETVATSPDDDAIDEMAEELDIRVEANAHEDVVDDTTLVLVKADVGRLQVVADVLAKSVILARHEDRVAHTFERVEPIARELEERGTVACNARLLRKHIGDTLLTEHEVTGRAEMEDKPEVLWERHDLELLYHRLEDEFEIRERHIALERKLHLISRTASTVVDLLHNRASLRVEWYIVILIVVEIVFTLYEFIVLH